MNYQVVSSRKFNWVVSSNIIGISCIMLLACLSCIKAVAQASVGATASSKPITYLLPDGKALPPGKIDSLEQAWGKGRIILLHDKDDDAKGIIHLVRQTDEMKKQLEEQNEQSRKALNAMLNKPAPDFELTDLQGIHWSLKALRGKIVVLNFWFTSCTPCIREMPELNQLAKTYHSKEVVFLALTFDNSEQVNRFLKKYTFEYSLLPGSGEVDRRYNISTWPISMVIDRKGDIKMIIQSSAKIGEDLGTVIDSLL